MSNRFTNPMAGRFVKAKKPKPAAERPHPEKEVDEHAASITAKFRESRKAKDATFKDIMEADYYLVLTFQSSEQTAEWARKAGMPTDDMYLDGMELAERMGIKLDSPCPPRQKPFRIQERWRTQAAPVSRRAKK